MFCPNCGAQNQDTATACAKCGFALKAATSAPKFKGTMLMMNAPTAQPRPATPGPGGAPPAGAPPAGAPPAGAPSAGPPPAAEPVPSAVVPKPKLKGTMIGVAPPSLGSNAPPVAAPVDPAGFGGPPPGFGAAAAPPVSPAQMPPQQPVSSVNPLGGTLVADAGSFGGAFPPPAPAPVADLGAPPPGLGAPPPGFGAAAPGGHGGDPGYGAAQNPSAMAPVPQMQPLAPAEDDMMPIPGTVGGPNPIVTVLLIVATCGIYGIYLLVKGKREG